MSIACMPDNRRSLSIIATRGKIAVPRYPVWPALPPRLASIMLLLLLLAALA